MNALDVPFLKRVIAGGAAFAVIVLANVLFRLPNALLALKFGAAAALVRVVAGEGPAFRAVDDLRYIFSQGGEPAAIFRRIVTHGRYADLAGIIQGAVVRSLPWA
jgi:hypothetical protein